MQRAAILSCVASLAPRNVLILAHNRRDFRKNVTEPKICFDFLYNFLFKTFLILKRIQRDIVLNVRTSSWKVSIIRVGF